MGADGDRCRVTVAVADDNAGVRSGLRLLLRGEDGLRLVGEAADVPGALRLVEATRPDVLVLDLNMPGPSSLDAIPEIRRRWPGTRVVVLTMQDDPAYRRAALQRGAGAYLLKDRTDLELADAVRAVAAA